MKNSVLAIIFVVAAAGCVGQGGDVLKSIIDVPVLTSAGTSEDLTITAKIPEFARQNRNFNWQIVAQPTTDIKDFSIDVYDTCKFTPVSDDDIPTPVEIKANRTKTYTLTYSLGTIDFEGDCAVKFKTEHKVEATASATVIALSDTEWQQRKSDGTLSELPVSTYNSNSPLKVSIGWSEDPRFLDASTIQMYVDYSNLGSGSIRNLAAGSVKITIPSNLKITDPKCDDYIQTSVGVPPENYTVLELSKSIDFVAKKAKRSTCNFKVDASGETIKSQSITAVAEYNYETDNSVKIPLLKK